MKAHKYWLIFGLVALAQWWIPLQMIAGHERTLREGALYRFRTQPVDPYDAFRGRYVAVRIEPEQVEQPVAQFTRKQHVFAVLGTDSNGFAQVDGLLAEPPGQGAYLKCRAWHQYSSNVVLSWPMDRYYMNEYDAPAAERLYREQVSRTNQEAYVEVRVRQGRGVIEKLVVNGKPIEELISEESRKQKAP